MNARLESSISLTVPITLKIRQNIAPLEFVYNHILHEPLTERKREREAIAALLREGSERFGPTEPEIFIVKPYPRQR